ncbi:hypothetical protein FN846DRAFT_943248 [Sphaerosporella brunnea]|uniref:HNH nuclease domain-containing protein n=1 Tax=Sphaerosporella brunnea TaxID=1250544 RepID=A0A5J5F104_9PEZI|nr:hypothetical protein FN846DRAFT_943248 [Sphaerosporella brunnea]
MEDDIPPFSRTAALRAKLAPLDIETDPTSGESLPASTTSKKQATALKILDEYIPESPSDKTVNILRAMIKHIPTLGKEEVFTDIAKEPDLAELARDYMNFVVFPLRAKGNSTPAVWSLSSRFFEDSLPEGEFESQQREQARLKKDAETIETEAAHIVPFAMASFSEVQRPWAEQIWSEIHRLFPDVKDFKPEHINDPSNCLTLEANLHKQFGKLNWALELTTKPNTYKFVSFSKLPSGIRKMGLLPNEYVTFVAHGGRYPLPRPSLLNLHAAVAHIYHASGMSDDFEQILEARTQITCLASDGSTPIAQVLMMVI